MDLERLLIITMNASIYMIYSLKCFRTLMAVIKLSSELQLKIHYVISFMWLRLSLQN